MPPSIRHALTLLAVTTDRRVDLAACGHDADHDALVDTADTATLQLGDQLGLRLNGLGDHHQTSGVLVQTVHDAGTRDIDDVRHMVQQGIEQRAVGVTGSRVHHQTGWLVDDEDLVVFVNNVELDVLSDPFTLGLLLGNQLENSATMHDVHGGAARLRPQSGGRP